MRPRSLVLLVALALAACTSPTEPLSSASLSGTVLDRQNRAVALAEVAVVSPDGTIFARDKTGDDGRYSVGRLPTGRVLVAVTLGRTGPTNTTEVELQAGENRLDLLCCYYYP